MEGNPTSKFQDFDLSKKWSRVLREANKQRPMYSCWRCPEKKVFNTEEEIWFHFQCDHLDELPPGDSTATREFIKRLKVQATGHLFDPPSLTTHKLFTFDGTQSSRPPTRKKAAVGSGPSPTSLLKTNPSNGRQVKEVSRSQPSPSKTTPYDVRDKREGSIHGKRLFEPNTDSPIIGRKTSTHITSRPPISQTQPQLRIPQSFTSALQEARRSNFELKPIPTNILKVSPQFQQEDLPPLDPEQLKIVRQPETRPISQEQLVAEVKGIYAGLVMVEGKCIQVDQKQAALTREAKPGTKVDLSRLLHEVHDILSARTNPSNGGEVKEAFRSQYRATNSINATHSVRDRRGGSFTAKRSPKQLQNELPVLLHGKQASAIADRGCSANLITIDLAESHEIEIRYDSKCPVFRLPISNGTVQPVGRATISCEFPGEPHSRRNYDFYVCEDLVAPLFLGRKFLKDNEIHTKYKHRLKASPHTASHIPYLCSISAENETQERLACFIGGKPHLARPDTGSVINAMSLDFAYEESYCINSADRKWIRLGDGSIHLTMGTTLAQVSLGDHSASGGLVDFDVIRELDVDVIFGEQLLLDADAFVQYADHFLEIPCNYLDFGSIALLSKAESTISRALACIGRTKPAVRIQRSESEELQELDRRDNLEFHRQRNEDARIFNLPDGPERERADDIEVYRRERYKRHRDGVQQNVSKLRTRIINHSNPSGTLQFTGDTAIDANHRINQEVILTA